MSTFNIEKAKAAGYTDEEIQAELAKRPSAAPTPPQNRVSAPEEAMSATKQALNTIPGAVAVSGAVADIPPDIRRTGMKTLGTLAGGGHPLAAGTLSAAGGLGSDIIDNPKEAAKAAGIAGQTVFDPVGASKRLMALKPEEIQGIAEQAKKGAVDFGEGAVAGTLTKMLGSITARGPFTGAVKHPHTAVPGATGRAAEDLGRAKDAAGAFKDYGGVPPARLKAMSEMITTPRGSVKLANMAKDSLQSGKEMGVTELLVMRQAAGQAEKLGGTFAPTYAATKAALTAKLSKVAPKVAEEIKYFADVARTTGLNETEALFPFFTAALSPTVGAIKTATLPWARRGMGAAVGATGRLALPAIERARQTIMERRRQRGK